MRDTNNKKFRFLPPFRGECLCKASGLEGKGGERPEALDAGTVKLVGTDKSAIIHNVSVLIRDPKAYEVMSRANNPYGDGLACSRIINTLKNT